MAVMGDGKFLLDIRGGEPGMGVGRWFYNGGDGKFVKSLYIVGRGLLTPLFMETPLYCLPSFFNFFPHSTHPLSPLYKGGIPTML